MTSIRRRSGIAISIDSGKQRKRCANKKAKNAMLGKTGVTVVGLSERERREGGIDNM